MKEVDVRGLSCPEPVLLLQEAMDQDPKETIKVIAGEAHVVRNIEFAAKNRGRKTTVKEVGLDYEITVES